MVRLRVLVSDITPVVLSSRFASSGVGPISSTWRRHTMVFGVVVRPSAPAASLVAGLCVVLFTGRPADGHRDSSDDDGGPYADVADRTSAAFAATARHCLAGVDPFLPCVNERAMAALELAEAADSMSLGPDLEMAVATPEDLAPKGVYSIGKPARDGAESIQVTDILDLVNRQNDFFII